MGTLRGLWEPWRGPEGTGSGLSVAAEPRGEAAEEHRARGRTGERWRVYPGVG